VVSQLQRCFWRPPFSGISMFKSEERGSGYGDKGSGRERGDTEEPTYKHPLGEGGKYLIDARGVSTCDLQHVDPAPIQW